MIDVSKCFINETVHQNKHMKLKKVFLEIRIERVCKKYIHFVYTLVSCIHYTGIIKYVCILYKLGCYV